MMNAKQNKTWENLIDEYDVVSDEGEIEITDGIAAVEVWNHDNNDPFNKKIML